MPGAVETLADPPASSDTQSVRGNRHPAGRSAGITALAVGLAVVALAASITTAVLAIANRASLANLDAADPTSIVTPIGIAVVGGLVASRRPRNPIGWLFLGTSVVSSLQGVENQYARFGLVTHPGSVPGAVWALWLNSCTLALIFPAGAIAMLMLLLPDGHLPSRRWLPVAVTAVVITAVVTVLSALAPGPLVASSNGVDYQTPANPIGVSAMAGLNFAGSGFMGGLLFVIGLVLLIISASAPLIRMRKSSGDERQQIKWIAYAVLITAILTIPLAFLAGPVLPAWTFDAIIVLGFGVGLPVAAGVAIFKHRLYDIDVVISRTLVYGALAVFITAVYVGIAVGIGALIGGGGKPNLGLSILATAIVALGFQPVRERMQKLANRLVYGRRATPYEVLAEFSERVAGSYAVDEVLPRMARVLAEGTGAQRAGVWLRNDDRLSPAAMWPADAAPAESVPVDAVTQPGATLSDRMVAVRDHEDLLGALSVTKRPGETMTPVEESLLTHLANQAGLVLKNVGLTSQLKSRLEELRASRQRLVAAQDEERRRLERNLHDGAQQHLVALKVKLGIAEILMTRDPEKARSLLQQLKSDADEALSTLRDLARGIYPPLLADQGLAAALEAQARKATLPVRVDAGGISRYSQESEAAVYFCCLEALQNIEKYAAASTVTVSLAPLNGSLVFTVSDNGRGFDPAAITRGSGLSNMEDRLDALGGRLEITSRLGAGTTLRGTVPTAEHGEA